MTKYTFDPNKRIVIVISRVKTRYTFADDTPDLQDAIVAGIIGVVTLFAIFWMVMGTGA
jgi:hypothetical protein